MFEQMCFANRSSVFVEARVVPQPSASADFTSPVNGAHNDTSRTLSTWQIVLAVALIILVPTMAVSVTLAVMRTAQRCFRRLSIFFS